MAETQNIPIQCPNCGTQFQAPIRSIVDVGKNPELRQAFLANQINVAICPKCHQGGLVELPLVYHDPDADFLAVYFPPQLNVPEMERQKMIGELTQALMRSLPPEKRKGYFLNPRQFINRQSLMDAVLGTIGISQEELDRQRKKAKLLEQLLVMADDPKGLQMMVKGQDANLDYEFFMILAGLLEESQGVGDEKRSSQLTTLRANLMNLTSWGKKATKQNEAIQSLADLKTPEALLERVVAADPDEVEAMAVAARPLFDYAFFQSLTERIDASSGAEKDRLTQMREQLVTLTERLDQVARTEIEGAVKLLQEIANSENPRIAVHQNLDKIDDTFMSVLAANLQDAERKGAKAVVQRLSMIYDELMAVAEEEMPPEVRFVNELLRAPYPDGTRAMLMERKAELTEDVMTLIDRFIVDLTEKEDGQSKSMAKRLQDVKAQALLMV